MTTPLNSAKSRRVAVHSVLLGTMIALALLVSGCQFITDLLFGGDEEAPEKTEACEMAEKCCVELEGASAYSEVGDRAGKRNAWPNHCPSWNARQDSECNELIDEVAKQKATIEKEHPAYDAEFCE